MRFFRLQFLLLPALVAVLAGCRDGRKEEQAPGVERGEEQDALVRLVARDRMTARRLDPADDGWDTEVFADAAQEQLARLGLLLAGKSESWDELREFVAEGVEGTLLDRQGGEVLFDSGNLQVIERRAKPAANGETRSGLVDLVEDLRGLRLSLQGGAANAKVKVKLKLTSTDRRADGGIDTTVLLLAKRYAGERLGQERATWRCHWRWDGGASRPQMLILQEKQAESVLGKRPEPWFSDCSEAAFGKNRSFASELGFGMHHWLQRVGRVNGMLYFHRHGIAVGDANGDGRDDLFLCQPAGLPNKLFLNQEDGRAIDVSRDFGVDWLDNTASALFVDLDNDGDQDLVLATFEGTQVLENTPGAGFRPAATLASPDRDLHALSAVDYDRDGDLDLYVTVDFSLSPRRAFLYHDANDGGRNQLFRNEGSWKFVEVTEEVGLGVNNTRHSLAAAWEDYDNDGDQDLYVANDYGKNCLYRNEGSAFVEVAEQAGAVDYGSGMSVSWGDYDRDGWVDLHVGNMFSSAGSRITSQERFLPGSGSPVRSLYRRFVRGNSSFRNEGDGSFSEKSEASGAMVAGWAWSSVFTDLENNGWEDLFVANGYITTPDTGDL